MTIFAMQSFALSSFANKRIRRPAFLPLAFICTLCMLHAAAPAPELMTLTGDTSPVHDPALIKANGIYYLFTTGGEIRSSRDLHAWTHYGRVFDKLPDWVTVEIPNVKGNYWAPDISFYQGEYRLYYAVSTFGSNNSAIGLAINKTLDLSSPQYRWIDKGLVIRSRPEDDFNAIDPNLAIDQEGNQWLDFGSFWGGIKMRRIDSVTGKLSIKDTTLYSLASRTHTARSASLVGPLTTNAIEAPFLVRHASFYYLFVSFDFCCRGARSNYYVVVGRSKQITGPYVDSNKHPMMEGGGKPLTAGTVLWRGPGHEAVLLQDAGGPDLMAFHAYEATTGKPWLQISTIVWKGGWPVVAPLPGKPLSMP